MNVEDLHPGPSVFRDSEQLKAAMTRLGVETWFDPKYGGHVAAAEAFLSRARFEDAESFLVAVFLSLHNGMGLARVADAVRLLDGFQLVTLSRLMLAASRGFDEIDAWLAS